MSYTPEEVVEAVEALVRNAIRRPRDILGQKRYDVTFNDLQEAVSGVFLLYPAAPYYVTWLGTQRLLDRLRAQAELATQLLDVIVATDRRVTPVRDVSNVSNARAALFELEAAVGQRSQGFKSIDSVPAFVRFKRNVEEFLATYGGNIKSGGEIVQTPQEARALLPTLFVSFQEAHLELVEKVRAMADAFDEYAALNLPALVAQGVVSKARQQLEQHEEELQNQDDEERLVGLRQLVLDLITARAVVRKYGSFTALPQYLTVEGTGAAYWSESSPAQPAQLAFDIPSPFVLVPGRNQVDFYFDRIVSPRPVSQVDSTAQYLFGGTQLQPYQMRFIRASGSFASDGVTIGDIVYVLSGPNAFTRWMVVNVSALEIRAIGSSIAQVDAGPVSVAVWPAPDEPITYPQGYAASVDGTESQNFTFFLLPDPNNTLSFFVDAAQISMSFSVGTFTANAVAQQINSSLGPLATEIKAEAYFSPQMYEGPVDVTVGAFATWTLQGGALDGLDIQTGDFIEVVSGPDAGEVFAITGISAPPVLYVETPALGVTPTTGTVIRIGRNRHVRLRFLDLHEAVAQERTLQISPDPALSLATTMLGFPSGAIFKSIPSRVDNLVQDHNTKSQRSRASVRDLPASAVTTVRSDPTDPGVVVFYKTRSTLEVTAGSLSIQFPAPAGVQVGDVAVLRDGPDPDLVWTITSIAAGVATATSSASTSSGTYLVEVGPNLGQVAGQVVVVPVGINTGRFQAQAPRPIPFEVSIVPSLPSYLGAYVEPVFFTATLNNTFLSISSRSTRLESRVTAVGHGLPELDGSFPATAGAKTTFFQLPSIPEGLEIGDFLDYHLTNLNTADESYEIVSIDRLNRVIEIDTALPVETALPFAIGLPMYKLRSHRTFNFEAYAERLRSWLARPEQSASFFIDLTRFINPLAQSKNPTLVQINDARNRLLQLTRFLSLEGAALVSGDPAATLEDALNSYQVERVEAIDTMIRSFLERGSDRAVDLLLEGRFSAFFSITVDGASYSGAMKEAMRELVREDLPIRRDNRTEAKQSRLLAQIDDQDYEYDLNDTKDPPLPRPPEDQYGRGSQ